MTDQSFTAKIRPTLSPFAQRLVAAYEAVPGALTYPGAMPEGLAAVLELVANDLQPDPIIGLITPHERRIRSAAAELRGEADPR